MAESESSSTVPISENRRKRAIWRTIGVVVICAAASFVSAWIILATGIAGPDAAITENRQTLVAQQGEALSEVYKKVSPSTVSITARTVDASQRFFAPQVREGSGSGFIISNDGYVITNKHVVPNGTETITVVLADGKQFTDVRLIGRDPTNDIAFLKINGANNLTPATLGQSTQVQPGQQVAAIGNALGLFRNSIANGIVSGIGRPIQTADDAGTAVEQLEDMLQTDAAINQGNSGGPLVNLKGEVIGINTAVAQNAQGIGFAIPIDAAKGVISSVQKTGKIAKAYLGIRYMSVDAEIADQLNLKATRGALIKGDSNASGVLPGGPADKAGLRDGDVIVKVNEQDITPASGFATKLAQYSPGDKVDMIVVRDGKEQKVTVTLGEFPADQ